MCIAKDQTVVLWTNIVTYVLKDSSHSLVDHRIEGPSRGLSQHGLQVGECLVLIQIMDICRLSLGGGVLMSAFYRSMRKARTEATNY